MTSISTGVLMRVFVTGASGHIASAVIPELAPQRPPGRRARPLRRLGARPSPPSAPRSAAAISTTSTASDCRRRVRRRHPPGLQARGDAHRRLHGRGRLGPGRHPGHGRGADRHRQAVRHHRRHPDARHGRDHRPPRHRGRPVRRRSARRRGQLHDRSGPAGRSFLGRAARARWSTATSTITASPMP